MKIILKSTFTLNEIAIETQSTTLGALLDELSRNNITSNVQFFDATNGEVYPDCDVAVNGQSYRTLASGLDTRLKDGDRVEIVMFTLVGG